MSEQEILDALEELEIATASELAEFIEIGISAIQKSLNRLLREAEVMRIELSKEEVTSEGIRFTGRHYKWKIQHSNNE